MKKEANVKFLKATNIVVILEVIVVLILLIVLLVMDWSDSDDVGESSEQVTTESSSLMDSQSSQINGEESSNTVTGTEQDSKQQLIQTESSNVGYDESNVEESVVITEDFEESQSEENWGEIDWD